MARVDLYDETDSDLDIGALAENYTQVLCLQTALSHTDSDLSTVSMLVKRIIDEDCWREWLTPEGNLVRWNAADFRLFLTSKRPRGCDCPIEIVERALRDTDAWEGFLELIRGEPGATKGEVRNPHGRGGKPQEEINRDILTVNFPDPDDSPATIPLPAPKPKRKRDYKREAPTGTSLTYLLRRLEKGEHYELLAKVKRQELSAHRACILAGIIHPPIAVPDDPAKAARRLARHFQGERRAELIRFLQEAP